MWYYKDKEFKTEDIGRIMETFKQFIKNSLIESGVTPSPIHYRHIDHSYDEPPNTPVPIHYRNISQLNEAKKVGADEWLFSKVDENKHLGISNDEVAKTISKKVKFTDSQKSELHKYTSDGDSDNRETWLSHAINTRLISRKLKSKTHKKTVQALDSAVKNNPLKHELHLWSGVSFDPREKVNEAGQMRSPAFISATHDKFRAHEFATEHTNNRPKNVSAHIIHFHLKPGDPAVSIHHISGYREHETLIGRGVTLQHHGTETYKGEDGRDVHIHHMSIV